MKPAKKPQVKYRPVHATAEEVPTPTAPPPQPEPPEPTRPAEAEMGHPRVITIAGTIDSKTVEQVAEQLVGLNAESGDVIVVQISSSGGHLQAGWALHDLFVTSSSQIVTAGFGYVGSAATIAFQAGSVRLLSPNAKLMIHLVGFSTSSDASFDLKEIRKQCKEMSDLQKDIERLLARRTGQPIARIRAWCAEETEFSARAAVKNGFADDVIRARPLPRPKRR